MTTRKPKPSLKSLKRLITTLQARLNRLIIPSYRRELYLGMDNTLAKVSNTEHSLTKLSTHQLKLDLTMKSWQTLWRPLAKIPKAQWGLKTLTKTSLIRMIRELTKSSERLSFVEGLPPMRKEIRFKSLKVTSREFKAPLSQSRTARFNSKL